MRVTLLFAVLLCWWHASAQQWTHVGPLSTNREPVNGKPNLFETGRVNLLEINPTNTQHLFCGGTFSGLWESSNGGQNWQRIPTEFLGSVGIGSIHFLDACQILVTHLHTISSGIKITYSEKSGVYNFRTKTWSVIEPVLNERHTIFDVQSTLVEGRIMLFYATSHGLFSAFLDELNSKTSVWKKLDGRSTQSLAILKNENDATFKLAHAGTETKSQNPYLTIKFFGAGEPSFSWSVSQELPVYESKLLTSGNDSVVSSSNVECILTLGEVRNFDDFDMFLLSDQDIRYIKKSAKDSNIHSTYNLMLYKMTANQKSLSEAQIVDADQHLRLLTGARTGLVYDAVNKGVWFSGVKLNFAFDPALGDKVHKTIRAGFKTGNGTIHDDIHELRIFEESGKRFLMAACDGGIGRSEIEPFDFSQNNIQKNLNFHSLNNDLHIMLVNGFSGASKDTNFFVVGGFDIVNTDFFRADEGRNEHTEPTWENAGGLIDQFDNSRIVFDVSLYTQAYRIARVDSLRNYEVSKNLTFYSPANPGDSVIRADLNKLSPNHTEVIGFQPRNFVQDPYRPGRIFYVKHKVGLHQLDLENGVFVRKLDLAEMNPEPIWAGWSNDWRWWRSVSFSPKDPNNMHIIINGSNDTNNVIQNPMVIRYVGSNLDACFGLDHTRFQNEEPQWELISEKLFARFNKIMGTKLSATEIQELDLLDVATNPKKDKRIYVLLRSKTDPSVKIVYFNGRKWKNYGQGLPDDEYPMSMVLDYKNKGGIYLATDKNIYYRNSQMKKWVCISGNYPKLTVDQMEINYVDNTIRIGTFGLGIWKMPLYKIYNVEAVHGNQLSEFPKDSAHYFASQLKHGTLFVELDDREGTRNKLLKANDTANLRRFDAQLNREFQEIFSAFEKSYSFGQVYFYKKSDREKMLSRSFSDCQILDKTGKNISLDSSKTQTYFFGQFIKYDFKENIATKDKDSGTFGQSVFLIRDNAFEVLTPKFKFYTKLAFRNKQSAIAHLNQKLLKLLQP